MTAQIYSNSFGRVVTFINQSLPPSGERLVRSGLQAEHRRKTVCRKE